MEDNIEFTPIESMTQPTFELAVDHRAGGAIIHVSGAFIHRLQTKYAVSIGGMLRNYVKLSAETPHNKTRVFIKRKVQNAFQGKKETFTYDLGFIPVWPQEGVVARRSMRIVEWTEEHITLTFDAFYTSAEIDMRKANSGLPIGEPFVLGATSSGGKTVLAADKPKKKTTTRKRPKDAEDIGTMSVRILGPA
jgi:hypothetical protein